MRRLNNSMANKTAAHACSYKAQQTSQRLQELTATCRQATIAAEIMSSDVTVTTSMEPKTRSQHCGKSYEQQIRRQSCPRNHAVKTQRKGKTGAVEIAATLKLQTITPINDATKNNNSRFFRQQGHPISEKETNTARDNYSNSNKDREMANRVRQSQSCYQEKAKRYR